MVDIRYDTPTYQEDLVRSQTVDTTEPHKEAMHMAGILSRFRIEALHNRCTIDMRIKDNKLILIGDNGAGKSTFISFIYFFLTKRWQRMLSYDFKSVLAVIDREEISFTRHELLEGKGIVPPTTHRVLYLPTYRRIGYDVRSLPPEWDSHSSVKDSPEKWRKHVQNQEYIELTYLSMQAVAETLDQKMAELKESLSQDEKEKDIREFVAACNQYLFDKEFIYNKSNFDVHIRFKQNDNCPTLGKDESGKELNTNMLSSGEKQIIALLSQIYFSSNSSIFLIIDEPEFSLSYLWQERFLPNIIASNRCSGFIVVTQAPCICAKGLSQYLHSIHEFLKAEVVE